MKDFLAERDARLEALRNEYAGEVQSRWEAAIEQNEDLQRRVTDEHDASNKANERYADNLLENYGEIQTNELSLLRDARAACEAAAVSRAEELRKQIIYAMHIMRYAGGRDSGSYGFGIFGSSFYGKGNSLTGIDNLDNYRLENAHGYAQTQDIGAPVLKLNNDETNRERQEESFDEARYAFDTMIQNSRDYFADYVATDKAESQAREEQVNADLFYATDASERSLANTSADAMAALAYANNARQASMLALTQDRVSAFHAICEATKDKVNGWFDEKVAYASEIYDSYYKEHLLQILAE
jgi:hypothetical protein